MEILKLPAAKKLRFYSDMHLDFYVNPKRFNPKGLWYPEPLEDDKETILVLAGDIWHAKKPFKYSNFSWFSEIAKRFKYVLVVLGNHDFWGGSLPTEYENFKRYSKDLGIENLFLLQNSQLIIGDNKFVGATLWTDFANNDFSTLEQAKSSSNDLKYIRYIDPNYRGVYKRLLTKHMVEHHRASKNYIFENAFKDYPEQKLWVITHHPPSDVLVTDPHLTKDDYGLVTNKLDDKIKESEIDYWIHGHNHQSGSAKVGNTLVMANTVGYLSQSATNAELNPDYNPWIELDL